jgi:hypothetical protein
LEIGVLVSPFGLEITRRPCESMMASRPLRDGSCCTSESGGRVVVLVVDELSGVVVEAPPVVEGLRVVDDPEPVVVDAERRVVDACAVGGLRS